MIQCLECSLVFHCFENVTLHAVPRHDNWGVHIHIFVFCPTDFFWKQLFLRYVNMNIWIYPPPQLSRLVAALSAGHTARNEYARLEVKICKSEMKACSHQFSPTQNFCLPNFWKACGGGRSHVVLTIFWILTLVDNIGKHYRKQHKTSKCNEVR